MKTYKVEYTKKIGGIGTIIVKANDENQAIKNAKESMNLLEGQLKSFAPITKEGEKLSNQKNKQRIMKKKQKIFNKSGIVIEDFNYETLNAIYDMEDGEEKKEKEESWYYWFQDDGKFLLDYFPKAREFNIGDEVGISFLTVLYEKKILEREFELDWNTVNFKIKSKRYFYDMFGDDYSKLSIPEEPTIFYGIEIIKK